MSNKIAIRILDSFDDLLLVEHLQRIIWPGSETDIIPSHVLLAIAHNGGLIIGAFTGSSIIGFVFGFPGLSSSSNPDKPEPYRLLPSKFLHNKERVHWLGPDKPRLKHCSHQMGVHPDYRSHGVGFLLKRAQWQMVRQQGIDLITWTYDPLLSLNANLNINKLGSVCNTYYQDYYGEMRDGLNIGLPSDRLQVDWWVLSRRVQIRLSKRPRPRLGLDHYLHAGAQIINPTTINQQGLLMPRTDPNADESSPMRFAKGNQVLLYEIPSDFMTLKSVSTEIALSWRLHSRSVFEALFTLNYIITDFIYVSGKTPRSYYVLYHGKAGL